MNPSANRPSAAPSLVADRPRRWPWAVAAATLLVFVLANVLYPSEDVDVGWTVVFSSIIAAFILVGALLAARVPANPIGPIILGTGALLASTVAIGTLAIIGAERGDVSLELLALAAIINDVGFQVPIIVILVGIPLIFPDGHLLSRRWRWVVVVAVSEVAAIVLTQVLGPGPLGAPELPNPFTVPALAGVAAALDAYASLASLAFIAGPLAVVIRYRRGDETQRQQLKWLIAVALVAAIAFPVAVFAGESVVADVAFVIGLLAMLALPIAIAVAILRYRLYEIDRIISRAIGWTLVTGMLFAAFIAAVVGLTALLSGFTNGETFAVAASTLAAAALFQPLRRRVQRAVDHRFDRARYDALRTADAFAERVRDEVDLEALAGELERTVVAAIRPSAAALWLPGRGTG